MEYVLLVYIIIVAGEQMYKVDPRRKVFSFIRISFIGQVCSEHTGFHRVSTYSYNVPKDTHTTDIQQQQQANRDKQT